VSVPPLGTGFQRLAALQPQLVGRIAQPVDEFIYISALYAVDLTRLREIGAGNFLRETWDRLSKDKNSLSNLDQDLPNYIQDVILICSLSQNWLWCGSWCSNDTMRKGKTIDMCNNPYTKEHKLTSAKRTIPVCTNCPSVDSHIPSLSSPPHFTPRPPPRFQQRRVSTERISKCCKRHFPDSSALLPSLVIPDTLLSIC
jgi:hypothetical protein